MNICQGAGIIFSAMDNSLHSMSSSVGTGALRVFLVEDSLTIRDLLVENLTTIPGIMLVGVSDSENDALEQLSHEHYDVLILDIGLKQGNGMSLLRALARLPEHEKRVKIIFTNNVSDTYRRAGEQYGVGFFFDKSSDFLQLRALMQQLASSASTH